MMRRVIRGLAGLVGGYAVTLVAVFTAGDLMGVSQAEGAFAMGVAFFWAPIGAVVCALCAALWGGPRR